MKKRILAAFAVLLALCLCLSACGGSAKASSMASSSAPMMYAAPSASAGGYKNEVSFDSAAPAPMEESKAEMGFADEIAESDIPDSERKIVYTGNMELETKEFDNALSVINSLISEAGGYISSQEISGASMNYKGYYERRAYITARVPSADFDSFMTGVSDICNVTSRAVWTDDISDTYYDSAARLESLELQEDRLLEILSKAERLEDIIVIEQELSNVRYQIESITAKLRRMDNQVDYSTVTLNLREVVEYSEIDTEPISFGEELKNEFERGIKRVKNFFKDLALWAVGDLPVMLLWLVLWGVIILVAVLVFKKVVVRIFSGRKKASKENKSEETPKEEEK
ncbi:MAG: DUF4349 domain-containing protein [Oscillospiraceae bacterium]|nr:DUF4349 domain-containing protein [Oscillospiraceae bacterium]